MGKGLSQLIEDLKNNPDKAKEKGFFKELKEGVEEEPKKFPEFMATYEDLFVKTVIKITPKISQGEIRETILRNMARRCLMEEYPERLAEKLSIYTEEEVRSLLRNFFADKSKYGPLTRAFSNYVGYSGAELFMRLFEKESLN